MSGLDVCELMDDWMNMRYADVWDVSAVQCDEEMFACVLTNAYN